MKRIDIDCDLWAVTEEYIDKQIATMRKYGAVHVGWDQKMRDETIYKVAIHLQKLRNLGKKQIDRRGGG